MSKINETNYPRRTQASYEDTDMLVIQEAGGNTYTTRIEDLREDCQETLAPALDTMRENLATIEGSTASKAYAKGDYLVFGGRLCKAKTSIAVNATLILDTNIELASVGGELSSLNSDLTSMKGKHGIVFYATCPPSANYGASRVTFGGNYTGITITLKNVVYRDGADPNVIDITSSCLILSDSQFPRGCGFCLQITNPPCMGKYLMITVDFD